MCWLMVEMNSEILQERLLQFAVASGKIVDKLPRTQMGTHISKQLIRSATSPASNYAEACAAESRNDFIHKLSICLKELRESEIWLELLIRANLVKDVQVKSILSEARELSNIIAKSIITAKKNKQRPKRK